jgi:GWxTD domain-containing protein
MKAPVRFGPVLCFVLAGLVLFLAGVPTAGASPESPTLNELFQKGKTEFRIAAYRSSLETFAALDQASLQPGNEGAREKLAPIITFYRAANLAGLGQADEAKKEFERYLEVAPNTRLDPGTFPPLVLEAFRRAKAEVAQRSPKPDEPARAEESGIEAAYRKFRPDPALAPVGAEPGSAAVLRFIMTREEKDAWQRTSSSQEKGEFLTHFWQRRDPSPATPENEFREEIERRIQFADTRFAADEKKGSETDRGLVFVLLGPPSYIAQKPFRSEDDSIQAARNAPTQELVGYDQFGRRVMKSVPREAMTTETIQGTREIWYYRRDRLPKAIRFPEVDFEFITKKGIGIAVLQRDHTILVTLDLAAKASLPREN